MSPENYKALREKIGTQDQVASLLGVARAVLAKRETGKATISTEAATALASLVAQAAIVAQLVSSPSPSLAPAADTPARAPEPAPPVVGHGSTADAMRILGLKSGVTYSRQDVKAAGKTAQARANPDLNPESSPEEFERVTRAYEMVLSMFGTLEKDDQL